MHYRQLGSTGIRVSEIGFGAWGIGGNKKGAVAYGPTDESESRAALLSAFESGVTFFDTADFYGFGHSEKILGETLRPLRARVAIATKVGITGADGAQDFSRKHILRSIDGSLMRLQTDYVDLYQLHGPPVSTLRHDHEIRGTMEELKQRGKIRAYGVSVRSPEEGVAAIGELGYQCVQVNFNLIDQRAIASGLFTLCGQRRAGIIVRTPLVFGYLTGRYTANDDFDLADHRRRWNPEQREQWASAHRLFQDLLDTDSRQTPAQFALRYCLSFPEVSTVIPGMLTQQHVSENVAASNLGALAPEIREKVMDIYRKHDFFAGNRI